MTYRAKTLYDALHMEKAVTRELQKALQAQMVENEVLKQKIAEMETGKDADR